MFLQGSVCAFLNAHESLCLHGMCDTCLRSSWMLIASSWCDGDFWGLESIVQNTIAALYLIDPSLCETKSIKWVRSSLPTFSFYVKKRLKEIMKLLKAFYAITIIAYEYLRPS